MKPHSYLEQAIAASRSMGQKLVQSGLAEGTFLEVKRIWEDDGRHGGSERHGSNMATGIKSSGQGSSRAISEARGMTREEVEVKEEKTA